jgi:hypothetical protein
MEINFNSEESAKDFMEKLSKGPAEIPCGKFDGALMLTKERVQENLRAWASRKDLKCVIVRLQAKDLKPCTGVIIHDGKNVSLDVTVHGKVEADLMTEAEKGFYLDALESKFSSLRENCERLDKVIRRVLADLGQEDEERSQWAFSLDRALRLCSL